MSDTIEHPLGETGSGSPAVDAEALGKRRPIEIWKPPTDGVRGYMWLEIVDPDGPDPSNIIKYHHRWIVRCHVWLYGDIWRCVCGKLCTEVCFTACAPKEGEKTISLEELAGKALCKKFKGCKRFVPGKGGGEGHVYCVYEVEVPPGKLPTGENGKPRSYEWTATLSLQNVCGDYEGIAGHDSGLLTVHGR